MSKSSLPTTDAPTQDGYLALEDYITSFEDWLRACPPELAAATEPAPVFERRVAVMSDLMAALFAAGWARHGWPTHLGGLGGDIWHRAAMWEALARHGVPGMAVFEHTEVLAPTLALHGPADFVADALPAYLSGRQLWTQGFSEPDAGSDLASLRTTAVRDGDEFVVNGSKIWTSWARYARWCLLLARTGTAESRHRGLSALIVDVSSPGVEVAAIKQANGTDELAEVFFDDVRVPADRVVGELDGGWAVAMHILSHERGTYAWFRHNFIRSQLREVARTPGVDPHHDSALGDAALDLFATTNAAYAGVESHALGNAMGPRATFNKLLLCASEQSTQDCSLQVDPDLVFAHDDNDEIMARQEYLFSRIVTIYGGSQQMQLETIAKQILGLP